jgi:hypothetical protein
MHFEGSMGVMTSLSHSGMSYLTSHVPVIPSILTSPTFELDGHTIDNPLYSYKLQQALDDKAEQQVWRKPAKYETVRYPLSGEYLLVASPDLYYSLRMLIYVIY